MNAFIRPTSDRRTGKRRAALVTLGFIALPVAVAGAIPASALSGSAPAESAADPADEAAVVDAFFAAGYSLTDALVLAERWTAGDTYSAKVKAGRYLSQGVALRDSPLADPSADDGVGRAQLADLFLAFGYTGEDAAVLAAQWGVSPGRAKVAAGRELKVVGVLPWVDPAAADDTPAIDAFAAAGYSYADAEELALRWGLPDAYAAKVKAGGYLKTGVALAASPYADPSADDGLTRQQLRLVFGTFGYTAEDANVLAQQWDVRPRAAKARAGAELKVVGVLPWVDPAAAAPDPSAGALDAYFAAGCTYDDALLLADLWGLGADSYAAKVKAGSLLVEGQPLPVTTPALGC